MRRPCGRALRSSRVSPWGLGLRSIRERAFPLDDYHHFVATFPDLDRPALAVRAPRFPAARLSWGDVLRLIPRLERYDPAGKRDRIVLTAEGRYAIGMRDDETGRGGFICAPDDVP